MLGTFGRRRRGRSAERRRVLAEEERDAVGAGADPGDLAARAQRVEMLGAVAGNAPRQHLRLPERSRQRERLQRHERLAQRRAAVDAVPAGQEPRERGGLDRLDLAPERRERRTAQPPQDVGLAPLALGAAGPKLAAHEQVRRARARPARPATSRPKRSLACAVVNGPRPFA